MLSSLYKPTGTNIPTATEFLEINLTLLGRENGRHFPNDIFKRIF